MDLAGSERLKRTGATGLRAKEGININSELVIFKSIKKCFNLPIIKRGIEQLEELLEQLEEQGRNKDQFSENLRAQLAAYRKDASKKEEEMKKLQLDLEDKEQQLAQKNEELQKLRSKQQKVCVKGRFLHCKTLILTKILIISNLLEQQI